MHDYVGVFISYAIIYKRHVIEYGYPSLILDWVTVHLSEVSFVRNVLAGIWLGLGLGLWLWLELGLGLASNFRICTTTFRTNDPTDK